MQQLHYSMKAARTQKTVFIALIKENWPFLGQKGKADVEVH